MQKYDTGSETVRKRTLVVGDIHGMYDELLRVLDFAKFTDSDSLIFVGDYINRGSRSREVLDLLIELSVNPEHVFLKGNHEDMVLKLSEGNPEYWYMWLEYGEGRACLRSYGIDPERIHEKGGGYFYDEGRRTISLSKKEETAQFIQNLFPGEHLRFMKNTIVTYETGPFFFSHAGIEKGIPLEQQTDYTDYFLIWGDEEFLDDEKDYGKVIVFGHFHQEKPLIEFKKVGIALRDAVSVFDLQNMLIKDSQGNATEVVKIT